MLVSVIFFIVFLCLSLWLFFSQSIRIHFSHGPWFACKNNNNINNIKPKKYEIFSVALLEFSNFNSTFYSWIQTNGLNLVQWKLPNDENVHVIWWHWKPPFSLQPSDETYYQYMRACVCVCVCKNAHKTWRILYVTHMAKCLSFGMRLTTLSIRCFSSINLCFESRSHTHFMCENFMMLEHSLVDHPYYILCIRQFFQRFDKTIRVRLFNFIENVTIKFKTIGLCPLFSDFHGLIFLCFVCVFCCCCNLIDIPYAVSETTRNKMRDKKRAHTHEHTHVLVLLQNRMPLHINKLSIEIACGKRFYTSSEFTEMWFWICLSTLYSIVYSV